MKVIPTPGSALLSPRVHTPIMIDFQSQMAFATKSLDAVTLRNNAALVANCRGLQGHDHRSPTPTRFSSTA